jgi:hypothetical protein
VGYGWSLSIPFIQRINKIGSQDLYGSTPYFSSSIDGELASDVTTSPNSTTTPSVLDPLDLTIRGYSSGTSDSYSYSVPSSGSNKLFMCLVARGGGGDQTPTVTIGGNALTMTEFASSTGELNYM